MVDLDAEIELLRQRIWKLRAERQTVLDHKDELLRRAWAVICWKCFGECRMQNITDLPTASEIEANIKTELGEMP